MAGMNKEAGSELPGSKSIRTTDNHHASFEALNAQNSPSTNSTSMNQDTTRPAGITEAGRAAVRAGLAGMPKALGDDTMRQVQQQLAPTSGSVAMGTGQLKETRIILTHRAALSGDKYPRKQVLRLNETSGVLTGQAAAANPAALTVKHEVLKEPQNQGKLCGQIAAEQLKAQGYRPCISTEAVLAKAPLRRIACGDVTIELYELPASYSFRPSTSYRQPVSEFMQILCPISDDPAGLRASYRALLFNAKTEETWRHILPDPVSPIREFMEATTQRSIDHVLKATGSTTPVADMTDPFNPVIYEFFGKDAIAFVGLSKTLVKQRSGCAAVANQPGVETKD